MSYSSTVLADSPIAYWRLDESSGTTASDSSGNGHNATGQGGTPAWGATGLIASDSTDAACGFTNGNGKYFSTGNLISAATAVSWEFWIKTTDSSGSTGLQWYSNHCVLDAEVSGPSTDWGICIAGGHIGLGIGSPDTTNYSTGTINDGNPHHVVCTWNTTGAGAIYIDGSLDSSFTGYGTAARSAPTEQDIGRCVTGGSGTIPTATIDEVAIFGSVLSATRVAAHYNAALITFTAAGQAPIVVRVPTTAQVLVPLSVTATGQAPILCRVPATAAAGVSVTAIGCAPLLPHIATSATAYITVPSGVIPSTEDGYAYLARTRTFSAVAHVVVPVTPAPATVHLADFGIPQVSETYDQPVVLNGLPYADSAKTPWGPASVTRDVWAKQLQVLVGGQDVTFFRGVPTVVGSWGSQEPFADGPATFTLPAVTTFDGLPEPAAVPTGEVVGIATSYTGLGYWQAAAEGLVSAYGDAPLIGNALGLLAQPVSGITAHPSAVGYALCAQDGGVFAFGDLAYHGNAIGSSATPIVGIASTATGGGYWLVAADGGVFSFGDAVFHGSAFGSIGYPTNRITGIARSGGGAGYILVANNGALYFFGDAVDHGNGVACYQTDYTAIATSPGVDGYLLVNTIGSAYAFGSVPYRGGVPYGLALRQAVNSVALTADCNGYWMSAGDGGIFNYGDAPFYGSIPGGGINVAGSLSWLRMAAPVTINRIDASGTAHILYEGIVADWEDATQPGQVGLQVQCTGCLFQLDWYIAKPVVDMPFIGFNPQTGQPIFGWDIGVAIAQAINSVSNPSAGTALGQGPQPTPHGSPANFGTCTPVNTGIMTVTRGNWDQLASGYLQNMLSQAQTLGGREYTVGLQRPRIPVIVSKNLANIDWTVSSGGHGVTTQLSFDQSTAATAIYGQGQSPPVLIPGAAASSLTGAWSGSAYPQAYPGTAPAFPLGGSSFAPGDTHTGLQPFSDWMRQSGIPLVSQDSYLAVNQSAVVYDRYLIEAFQQNAGLQVTGLIDAGTWNAAFTVGNNVGAVVNSFYQPLWQLPQVEPYTYSPSGAVTGNNPLFNPRVPRVERFEQMGQQLAKAQGVVSARIEGERIQQPSWAGTITLTADPEEGSRFDIQAGQNILLRWFRARDTLFHISQVQVDFTTLTVTLTVCSQAQDLMTLSAIWARDAQAHGTARVGRPSLVSLNITSNTTVFDSESGAGRLWPVEIVGGQWSVVRVPFSEAGQVALVDLTSSPSTPFAVGVFSAPVTPSQLAGAIGPNGPLTADAAGNNPWNDFAKVGYNGADGLDSLGMLYGAGGPNGACGYWPSDPNGTQTLTGHYIDQSTWPYASAPGYVPWVWVAVWAATDCTVSGRFMQVAAP